MAKAFSILVVVSLVAAVIFLGLFFTSTAGLPETGSGGVVTPSPGEPIDPQAPAEMVITADDLRELALALAAVITAITGLLGIVASQVWRGKEESRVNQTHQLALERERLELERERWQLDKERMEFERQKEGASRKEG